MSGSECDIGANSPFTWSSSPDPSIDPTGLIWWLIIATDGSATEGSWSQDGSGLERSGPGTNGSSVQCGVTDKDLSNLCGQ